MEIWEAVCSLQTNPYVMTVFGMALVALGYVWGKGWLTIEKPKEKC